MPQQPHRNRTVVCYNLLCNDGGETSIAVECVGLTGKRKRELILLNFICLHIEIREKGWYLVSVPSKLRENVKKKKKISTESRESKLANN